MYNSDYKRSNMNNEIFRYISCDTLDIFRCIHRKYQKYYFADKGFTGDYILVTMIGFNKRFNP